MLNTEDEADIINAVMLNKEYEADIKIQQGRELDMHEKPETRNVMNDITDVVMRNTKYEADVIDAVMHDENEDVTNVMDENNTAAPIEDLQLYYYQYISSKGWCQKCVEEQVNK
jgi:hypothetical protein